MHHLKKIFIVVILSILSFSGIAQGFKIEGTAIGIKDSAWLYLRTANPEIDLDSAMVISGRFTLSGKIKEKAAHVYLHTARYADYVGFWIENESISMDVKAGEFKQAVIKGSDVAMEDKRLSDTAMSLTNRQDSLQQFYKNYVKTHPQSPIAVDLLNVYSTTWGKNVVKPLYRCLSSEMKNTRSGKEVRQYIAVNKDIRVGDRYMDFKQLNAKDKKIKLSAIKGKYILLDFWASWCGPCREENPKLVKTYELFRGKGLSILGVSLDDNKASWLKAIKEDGLSWENVTDLHGSKNNAALIYGIYAIPSNFLIDEKGIIIAKNLRGKALETKLQELLP